MNCCMVIQRHLQDITVYIKCTYASKDIAVKHNKHYIATITIFSVYLYNCANAILQPVQQEQVDILISKN